MVVDDQTAFQVRVGAEAEFGDYIDGDNGPDFLKESFNNSVAGKRPGQWAPHLRTASLYNSIKEVGPHSPDGSYSRVAWNPLHPYETGSRIVLEWARLDEHSVLAKVSYTAPFGQIDYNTGGRVADIVLEAYSPWDAARGMVAADYAVKSDGIIAASQYRPVVGEYEWNRWQFSLSSSDPQLKPESEPGRAQGFFRPELDDHHWKEVRWGTYWQEEPRTRDSGYGWYRQRIVIPSAWKGQTLRFDLGKVTENDWTFLNGTLIGNVSGKDANRSYEVKPDDPAYSQIRWDTENVLAVQVQSSAPLGGISSGDVVPWGRSAPPAAASYSGSRRRHEKSGHGGRRKQESYIHGKFRQALRPPKANAVGRQADHPGWITIRSSTFCRSSRREQKTASRQRPVFRDDGRTR